ncbi:hypothetical protein PEC311524_34050 [Pectobacterium carotovorum subsp. carotovorum]|nr:hypothetical protein PEC311524_34050 [Pectobacterium carotovorum subsp. carotovorum]
MFSTTLHVGCLEFLNNREGDLFAFVKNDSDV